MSNAFGQSMIFGQPRANYETNVMYSQQATLHAQAHPNDVQAQRQAAYWAGVVRKQAQALSAQAAAASGPQAELLDEPGGQSVKYIFSYKFIRNYIIFMLYYRVIVLEVLEGVA